MKRRAIVSASSLARGRPVVVTPATKQHFLVHRMTLRRGLLIGINYKNTNFALSGCINDSQRLRNFLLDAGYLDNDEIVMMNDEQEGDLYPTRKNIEEHLAKLIEFARQNRSRQVELFVSYSGHGYHLPDDNGDETDGQDEVLCPVDCDTQGYLVDDWLRKEFLDKLPVNVNLVMLIDACHSGTAVDLRFTYKKDHNKVMVNPNVGQCVCNVTMVSGCRDDQTSADADLYNPDKRRYEYQGAMTASFLMCYHHGITYDELLDKMRAWLVEQGFDQVPQMSAGKFISVGKKFPLIGFR